jgi:hypothetical protein
VGGSRLRKGETKNWLRRKLIARGVESRFATILARRKAANSDLLKLDPKEMNRFFYSLIEEYKEAGFDEKIALSTLGKLRKLKKLGLPVNANTISRNPKTLLKNKEELERLGLPVTATTICHNPKTLLKKKEELERLGLPVTATTICYNPKTLLKKKEELERLGLPVNSETICRNPKTITKKFKKAEK